MRFIGGTLVLALPRRASASQVDSAIAAAARASTGTVGVFARTMSPSAAPVAYNADESFPTASVIKVLILVTLFRRVDRDPALLERRIATPDSKVVDGSPMFDSAAHDAAFSVATLAHAMIVESDNTASNQLIDLLGFESINATAQAFGLTHTHLRRHFMDVHAMRNHSENVSTPRDMGSLLYQIERGWREGIRTIASPLACKHMIDLMLQQEDREKIGSGIPHGIPLANKTGEITAVRNDIAIVDPYGDSPYILAVLTKNLDDFSLGVRAIRHIARAVHATLYER
jgi:beta-lactamase class A